MATSEQRIATECTIEEARTRLTYWRNGGNSFACKLFDLFQKADNGNFVRLTAAFPVHSMVYCEWLESEHDNLQQSERKT